MSRYKIGDTVTVRPDINHGEKYYSCDGKSYAYAVNGMLQYRGEKVLIVKINNNSSYKIQNDKGRFFWVDEMFMPYTDIHPIDIGSMI